MTDWAELFPDDPQLVWKQKAWDKGMLVLRLRELGETRVQIAKYLGVSAPRVRQIEAAQNTRLAQKSKSPVEAYLSGDPIRQVSLSPRERNYMKSLFIQG